MTAGTRFQKVLDKNRDMLKKWETKNHLVDTESPKTQQAVKEYLLECLREAGFMSLYMLIGSVWVVKK